MYSLCAQRNAHLASFVQLQPSCSAGHKITERRKKRKIAHLIIGVYFRTVSNIPPPPLSKRWSFLIVSHVKKN